MKRRSFLKGLFAVPLAAAAITKTSGCSQESKKVVKSKPKLNRPDWSNVVTDKGFSDYHHSVSRALRLHFGKQVEWCCSKLSSGLWYSSASFEDVQVLGVGEDECQLMTRKHIIEHLDMQWDSYLIRLKLIRLEGIRKEEEPVTWEGAWRQKIEEEIKRGQNVMERLAEDSKKIGPWYA
jgi:hypothetical protein